VPLAYGSWWSPRRGGGVTPQVMLRRCLRPAVPVVAGATVGGTPTHRASLNRTTGDAARARARRRVGRRARGSYVGADRLRDDGVCIRVAGTGDLRAAEAWQRLRAGPVALSLRGHRRSRCARGCARWNNGAPDLRARGCLRRQCRGPVHRRRRAPRCPASEFRGRSGGTRPDRDDRRGDDKLRCVGFREHLLLLVGHVGFREERLAHPLHGCQAPIGSQMGGRWRAKAWTLSDRCITHISFCYSSIGSHVGSTSFPRRRAKLRRPGFVATRHCHPDLTDVARRIAQ
jgi:hypothetical protein